MMKVAWRGCLVASFEIVPRRELLLCYRQLWLIVGGEERRGEDMRSDMERLGQMLPWKRRIMNRRKFVSMIYIDWNLVFAGS